MFCYKTHEFSNGLFYFLFFLNLNVSLGFEYLFTLFYEYAYIIKLALPSSAISLADAGGGRGGPIPLLSLHSTTHISHNLKAAGVDSSMHGWPCTLYDCVWTFAYCVHSSSSFADCQTTHINIGMGFLSLVQFWPEKAQTGDVLASWLWNQKNMDEGGLVPHKST